MRISVSELAKAQGLRDQFEGLQSLRHRRGICGAEDLQSLPESVKQGVLGIESGTNDHLEEGLSKLIELVDQCPPRERLLLRLSFNLDQAFGDFGWTDRAENFSVSNDWAGSARNVRHKSDLALLQLLMRTCPAAEILPVPHTDVLSDKESPSSINRMATFGEDYVRNSARFTQAWEIAYTVDMCGFGHNRMAVTYAAEMGRILQTGGSIRVLAQDPNGRAVLDANRRSSTPKAAPEAVRYQHLSGISTFQAILTASGAPASALQLRVYDIMPPFTGYFFDSGTDAACAFIWFWSWRQPSSWRPGFSLARATDELWYNRFQSQFEMMWTDEDTHEFSLAS